METNRGRGERGGVEHPGEPAARYARRAIPLFLPFSILPSWSFLLHPILPFSLLPLPVILSNLDPFAHLSLCFSLSLLHPFSFLSLYVPRFQGNATLNNVPCTRLSALYMHVSLLSNKWILCWRGHCYPEPTLALLKGTPTSMVIRCSKCYR